MRTKRLLGSAAIALVVALGTAGCGGGGDDDDSKPAAPLTSTTAGGDSRAGSGDKATPDQAPVVTLIDAGAEPRKPLRLALVQGSKLRAALTLKFGIQLEADGKPLPSNAIPPIRVDLATTVTEVRSNGDARVAFAYERIEVVDDGTAEKAVVEQVRASGIDKLANVKGETTITPRGLSVDNSIDVPEDLPPTLKQVVDQLSQQTGNLTVPFPEEAVGTGATWSATTTTTVGGVKAKLVLAYGLRELKGDQYALDVSYEQTADPQKAEFPGVPPGTTVQLKDLLIKGKGDLAGTLASAFPTRSALLANGEVNLDITSEKEKGKLLQRLTIDVKFEALPPA